MNKTEIIVYETEDRQARVLLRAVEGTVWLSQREMAQLFDKDARTVNEHIQTVIEDGEVDPTATIRKFRIVRKEGSREVTRAIDHYNLDAILAVGYRVRSPRGVQFRRWATTVLKEFLLKGFAMDDERLKNPDGRPDYFDELLERIRDIRASEKRFYQKVRDLFALTFASMKSFPAILALVACAAIARADGQRVWPSERSDYRDEVTGAEVWRLTTDPEVEIIPDRIKEVFSPDGSKMLFRSKRNGAWHLYVMEADGSKITRVTNKPTIYGVWSRSGRSLVCAPTVNNRAELHEIDVSSFASRRIAGPFDAKMGKLGVSPDGTGVLFTRFIKQPDGEKQDVMLSSFVNLDGAGLFDFTGETKHGRIGWIPGRMDIRRMKSSRQQYVVQPDGSGARLIGEGGHEYFTPDGRRMIICDPKGGDPSKWLGRCSAGLYEIATGKRRDVTRELTWVGSHPAISADGRYVAIDNAGHSYPGAVLIVDLTETDPLRVLCYHHASWESGHITHPTVHWSPDGTKLVFMSDKDSPDKKKGDMYLTVVKRPVAPLNPHVANNRAEGPLLTWRPAKEHHETKEYVIMRSVPSPRPNLQRVFLDRTGVFEEIGVVPVVDTWLAGAHLERNETTIHVESTKGFPKSGQLMIAGNHAMAEPEIVTYEATTDTAFLNCQRGAEDTAAAMHWSGARIWSLSAMQFTDTNIPDRKRNYYYTVRAREHSGLISPYSKISNAAVLKGD